MRPNRVRQCWQEDRPAISAWLSMTSLYGAELAGHSGVDSVVVDLQHGMTDVGGMIAMFNLYRVTDDAAERGYKRVLAAPQHPDYAAFFGLQGNPLGYNDLKVIEARRVIEAIALGKPWVADFDFGYAVDRVVEAALVSAKENRWVRTEEIA